MNYDKKTKDELIKIVKTLLSETNEDKIEQLEREMNKIIYGLFQINIKEIDLIENAIS